MLVYELCNKCGNWIDQYRIITPDGKCYENFDYTAFLDMYTLADVKRFQIEKTAGVVTMEVVL